MLACVARVSGRIFEGGMKETHSESKVGSVGVQPGLEVQFVERAALPLEGLTEANMGETDGW